MCGNDGVGLACLNSRTGPNLVPLMCVWWGRVGGVGYIYIIVDFRKNYML